VASSSSGVDHLVRVLRSPGMKPGDRGGTLASNLPRAPLLTTGTDAIRTVAFHPGPDRWSLLGNGVVVSDDMGEILPEGRRVAAAEIRIARMEALVSVPTVRGAYDAIERRLAPRLEALVRNEAATPKSPHCSPALAHPPATKPTRVSTCLLHACNLPARPGHQLACADSSASWTARVRQLRLELAAYAENRREEPPDADA